MPRSVCGDGVLCVCSGHFFFVCVCVRARRACGGLLLGPDLQDQTGRLAANLGPAADGPPDPRRLAQPSRLLRPRDWDERVAGPCLPDRLHPPVEWRAVDAATAVTCHRRRRRCGRIFRRGPICFRIRIRIRDGGGVRCHSVRRVRRRCRASPWPGLPGSGGGRSRRAELTMNAVDHFGFEPARDAILEPDRT